MFMSHSALITCATCNTIFNTEEEKEEHAFQSHYEKSSGLTRAEKWADLML